MRNPSSDQTTHGRLQKGVDSSVRLAGGVHYLDSAP